MQSAETLAGVNKQSEGGKKHKLNEGETETPKYFVGSSSKIVNSRRIVRHVEKNYQKIEEKKKVIDLEELSKRFIKEVDQRIGRFSANSPTDKAMETMKGISKSPFTSWIVREVKPKEFGPSTLDKFDGKENPAAHLLQFKQRISPEEITEGLVCKLALLKNLHQTSFGVVQSAF